MIDGYWLPQTREITWKNVSWRTVKRILLLYYDYIHHKVIWFSIRDGEKKAYIEEDLRFLKYHMGYDAIISCTCDWWFGIISALKEVYPNIVIQRCLVHIQRQVRAYISKRPKSDAGKDLARLMRKDILFSSVRFIEWWKLWKEKHSSFLDEKTKGEDNRWRYTHTRLRKAVRHIENALPYMFPSEEHIQKEMTSKEIAQTSNRIEGYFWVLTNEGINEHKGLSPERLMKFISLWIYLHNRK
jgi:transposase-like protein